MMLILVYFPVQRFSDPTPGKNHHNVYLTREPFVVATSFSSAFVIVNSQPESSIFCGRRKQHVVTSLFDSGNGQYALGFTVQSLG